MDIDLLSKMVKELILDNDRVVLPGLGSFVAEIVPSAFTDRGYTITPPYRRLYFRSKPDEGEMLVRFYAETNGIEPEMAERIIRDFVSELKSVLHSKKAVVFPGLGRLRATKENNLFFVADEDLDIYPAGFGLEPISLKTHEETPQEVTAVVEELKEIMDEPIDIELDEELVPMDWERMPEEPDSLEDVVAADEPEVADEPEQADEAEVEPEEESLPVEESQPEEELPEEELPEEEPELVEEPVIVMEDPADDPEIPEEPVEVTEDPFEPEEPTVEEESIVEEEPAVLEEEPVRIKIKERPERNILKTVGMVVAGVIVLLVIYMLVMRIFPDFLNEILYTPEELEIINFR